MTTERRSASTTPAAGAAALDRAGRPARCRGIEAVEEYDATTTTSSTCGRRSRRSRRCGRTTSRSRPSAAEAAGRARPAAPRRRRPGEGQRPATAGVRRVRRGHPRAEPDHDRHRSSRACHAARRRPPVAGAARRPPSTARSRTAPPPKSGRDMPVAIAVGLLLAAVFLAALMYEPWAAGGADLRRSSASAAVEFYDKVSARRATGRR